MDAPRSAEELISNAHHDSVTKKRLTNLKGGLTARYLYDKPLIEYLNKGEQPEFILAARSTTPTFLGSDPPSWTGRSPNGMAMHMVTDERWLIVVGVKNGDEVFEILLEDVINIDYSIGKLKHKISLRTTEHEIEIPIGNMYDSDEIEDVVDYIREIKSSRSVTPDSDIDDSEHQTLQELREAGIGTQQLATELVNRATDSSVTRSVLTELETDGWGEDYLRDEPLIEYLEVDEQPNVIITTSVPPEFTGEYSISWDKTKGYSTIWVATNQRLLIVQGHKDGDMSLTIPYEDIIFAEVITESHRVGLEITTTDGNIEMSPTRAGMLEEHEVRPFIEYIREMSDVQEEDRSKQVARKENIPEHHGSYVTRKRVDKIRDVLDEDEQVHYLTRGSTVDVEGSSAGESLFGDDRSRKSGTKGWVRTGITDRRVVVKVPQWLGNDERSVPYQNITSIDLDTGFATKRLSLQTPGQTYHIEAGLPDKEEIRDAVQFIRNKITESNDDQVVIQSNDEPDPTEQLQNLKELHDEGVLTDEEFEEKKQSLLEKI